MRARECRSNARPVSRRGCTHAMHVASCSHRTIVLIMRRVCAAMLAGRSQRAGAVPPWAWRLAAARWAVATSSCSRCLQHTSEWLVMAARGRLRDHQDGAHGSSRVAGARQACWPDPPWPWLAAVRPGGALRSLSGREYRTRRRLDTLGYRRYSRLLYCPCCE